MLAVKSRNSDTVRTLNVATFSPYSNLLTTYRMANLSNWR